MAWRTSYRVGSRSDSLSIGQGVNAFQFHVHDIGEPATLAQCWDKWKAEFALYVAASGVEDKVQKQALLLHLAGPGVLKIFKMYPNEIKGDAKDVCPITSKSRRMYL